MEVRIRRKPRVLPYMPSLDWMDEKCLLQSPFPWLSCLLHLFEKQINFLKDMPSRRSRLVSSRPMQTRVGFFRSRSKDRYYRSSRSSRSHRERERERDRDRDRDRRRERDRERDRDRGRERARDRDRDRDRSHRDRDRDRKNEKEKQTDKDRERDHQSMNSKQKKKSQISRNTFEQKILCVFLNFKKHKNHQSSIHHKTHK